MSNREEGLTREERQTMAVVALLAVVLYGCVFLYKWYDHHSNQQPTTTVENEK